MRTSAKRRAWRNVMVAAINAGLDQGHFGLEPGDNRWPDPIGDAMFEYNFNIGDIPALAGVFEIGGQELRVAAALWPTEEGRKWINVGNGIGFDLAPVSAMGWLERKLGYWLQDAHHWPTHFKCRRHYIEQIAAISIEPNGYADHGRFIP